LPPGGALTGPGRGGRNQFKNTLQHARKHLDLLASGSEGEDHLGHAACRLLMALEIRERTAKTRAAGSTPAEAPTDSDQMPLFASMAPMRQT